MSIGSKSRLDPAPRPASSGDGISPGDYFHSERRLYCVTESDGRRALIEDCLTGVMIEIEVSRLLELDRIRR